MSLKDTREAVVLAYDGGVIDDEDFCLLFDVNQSKNPGFPYEGYGTFDLAEMDDAECKAEFRLRKADISVLAEALDIPETFTCNQGSVIDGIEGHCVLLRRFSYPGRYSDLIPRFGQPVPVLIMICGTVTDHIYTIHGHRISEYNHSILDPTLLHVYRNAVSAKGADLDNCFGFVDGTVRPIFRSGDMQRTVYNGPSVCMV